MQNKYHAKKVQYNGMTFDSKHELERWQELQILQRAGVIEQLKRQVKFDLIPAQKIGGKLVERAAYYVADFTYLQNGRFVVEDAKSPATRTPEYILKRKLLLWIHGIRVKEV